MDTFDDMSVPAVKQPKAGVAYPVVGCTLVNDVRPKKDWFVNRIYLTERGAEPRTESDKFGCRELALHLIRREPAEYGHRNVVAAI